MSPREAVATGAPRTILGVLAGLANKLAGPVFTKELRVASRRRRHYALRFVYLGLLRTATTPGAGVSAAMLAVPVLAMIGALAVACFVKVYGAVFLGAFCPEAVGDYVAGPNHVLPTGRTARFASGLSVFDFLKRTTFVSATQAALDAVGPAAVALAEAEGLQAHARSIALRLSH